MISFGVALIFRNLRTMESYLLFLEPEMYKNLTANSESNQMSANSDFEEASVALNCSCDFKFNLVALPNTMVTFFQFAFLQSMYKLSFFTSHDSKLIVAKPHLIPPKNNIYSKRRHYINFHAYRNFLMFFDVVIKILSKQ